MNSAQPLLPGRARRNWRRRLGGLVLGCVLCLPCHADLPVDPGEYAAWEAKMLAAIQDQSTKPADEAIPKLGKCVHQLSMPHNREKGERPVFHAARRQLLAMDGYAKWYASRIHRALELVAQGEAYNRDVTLTWDLELLGQLPSPPTIRILGDLLQDCEGEPEKPDPLNAKPMTAFLAMKSLASLNIENPPAHTLGDLLTWRDFPSWQLWYAQVKAGTRTFRFEGDPQEYNLEGPVSALKIAESRKPTRETPALASSPSSTNESQQSKVPTAAIAITSTLLTAASAFLIRQKRGSSS